MYCLPGCGLIKGEASVINWATGVIHAQSKELTGARRTLGDVEVKQRHEGQGRLLPRLGSSLLCKPQPYWFQRAGNRNPGLLRQKKLCWSDTSLVLNRT